VSVLSALLLLLGAVENLLNTSQFLEPQRNPHRSADPI